MLNNFTDRENLEHCVWVMLQGEEPLISFGRGKELLNFRYMEEMRDWYNRYHKTGKKMIDIIFIISTFIFIFYHFYKFDKQKTLNDEAIERNKQEFLREQLK